MKKFVSFALSAVLGISVLGCADKPAPPPTPAPVEVKPAPDTAPAPAPEEKK